MHSVRFAGFRIKVPSHPVLRLGLGILLVIGGLLGFLPVLGFWMVPLGLIILSIDFSGVRRFRRVWSVRIGVWLASRQPWLARMLGFGKLRDKKTENRVG